MRMRVCLSIVVIAYQNYGVRFIFLLFGGLLRLFYLFFFCWTYIYSTNFCDCKTRSCCLFAFRLSAMQQTSFISLPSYDCAAAIATTTQSTVRPFGVFR